jgi:uncharacterized protein
MTDDLHEQSTNVLGDRGEVTMADNADASRFELRLFGQLAGYATYRDLPSGRAFEHTVIASEFEGLGLASQLIGHALAETETAGLRVLPFCPFVRAFIQRHPDYLRLVDQRQRFGLTESGQSMRPDVGIGSRVRP